VRYDPASRLSMVSPCLSTEKENCHPRGTVYEEDSLLWALFSNDIFSGFSDVWNIFSLGRRPHDVYQWCLLRHARSDTEQDRVTILWSLDDSTHPYIVVFEGLCLRITTINYNYFCHRPLLEYYERICGFENWAQLCFRDYSGTCGLQITPSRFASSR